jgi:hypothetical protein
VFKACQALDAHKSGVLAYDKMCVILTAVGRLTLLQVAARAAGIPLLSSLNVSFAFVQSELLLRRIQKLDAAGDSCPYQAVLSGQVKPEGLRYDGLLVKAWVALERNWAKIAESFQRFDTDFNGKVTVKEPRFVLRYAHRRLSKPHEL